MSLLASGNYRYWRDGVLQVVTEPWQLSRTAHGLRLKGQRLVEGQVVLEVDADYAEARCTAMRLRWQSPDRVHEVRYQLRGGQLEWLRAVNASAASLALPAGSRLFPLLRAATGPLLRHLTSAARTVVVPCIRDPAKADFLQPLLSERRAIAGQARHYRYLGGEYGDAGCDCWLDQHGLLQRYRWASAQGEWEVRLDDLQTAPGFAGFAH